MKLRMTLAVVACLLVCRSVAQAQTVTIAMKGGNQELKNVPVCVPLSIPKDLENYVYAHVSLGNQTTEGQLTAPGIGTEGIAASAKGLVRRDLHFLLPSIKKGESLTVKAKLIKENNAPDTTGFFWLEKKGEYTDLFHDVLSGVKRRPVMRYMHAPYDASTPEKQNKTYKVFHHLFDPSGKRLVTNGGHTDPYTDEKTLLYPHHRGLMYAFNKITYGDGLKKQVDTWHAKPGDTHQEHDKVLLQEAGALLGRHRVLVKWCGAKNDVFATEERELTVYDMPGGTLVEFASKLMTADGTVRLDGDPQHAGFQFRAANEVAGKDVAKQTYFLRPDGKGEPGATRNWEPKTKQGPVNLPWDAMCFVLGGHRYTACYFNSPTNPKESRFSERDYGRFGCYFEYEVTREHPLVVNYRIWLQDGEITAAQVEALYQAFAHLPGVSAGKFER